MIEFEVTAKHHGDSITFRVEADSKGEGLRLARGEARKIFGEAVGGPEYMANLDIDVNVRVLSETDPE